MSYINVLSGLKDDAIMVLSTTKHINALEFSPQIARFGLEDATKIAIEVLGIAVTHTTMVAAFAKTTGWIDVASAFEGIRRL